MKEQKNIGLVAQQIQAVIIYVEIGSLTSRRPCCHRLMYTKRPCANASETDPCTFIECNE